MNVLVVTRSAARVGRVCRLLAQHDPQPIVVVIPVALLEQTRDELWAVVFADPGIPLPAEFDARDTVTVQFSRDLVSDVREAFARVGAHGKKGPE